MYLFVDCDCICNLIGPEYNPETAERLILMDKDQAAQKLHFVSDHFVLKANICRCIYAAFLKEHGFRFKNLYFFDFVN